MNTFKQTAINVGIEVAGSSVSRIVGNKQLWADSKAFAVTLMDSDIKGVDKHEKIKKDLLWLFKNDIVPLAEAVIGALLDALIKLAFVYATSKINNIEK